MEKKSKILIASLLGIAICVSILTPILLTNLNDPGDNNNGDGDGDGDGDGNELPEYEKILLNRFPISLDMLFYLDQPATHQTRINNIKSASSASDIGFIIPYANYYHGNHYPMVGKWYLYADRYLPMSFPVESYMKVYVEKSTDTETINGSVILKDVDVGFHLSYYITIRLDHVCINQSLIDAYDSAPSDVEYFDKTGKVLHIPANTTFGMTHDMYATDFIVQDRTEPQYKFQDGSWSYYSVNPFFYFTESAQEEIQTYYDYQYDAMIESGEYIESRINRTNMINNNNTLFGSWFYEEGPLELTEDHHLYGWYSFDGCILNIINLNDTDQESFYQEFSTPFTDDMIGVFGDADYSTPDFDNYDQIGVRYMHILDGSDFTSGIINLTDWFNSDYSGDVFLRYSLTENDPTVMWDDQLKIEVFTTLIDAESGFTSNNITYWRSPHSFYP